jgi:glycosyltransferase involved in cell wall biosynthesis
LRISLIMATIKRTQEISRFLAALDMQSYQNFELIVVDQNSDDRLLSILEPYHSRFSIVHLHSAPGLSKARNLGLQHIKGEIVAFPDDDCCYSQHLLEKIVSLLQQQPNWDGISGRPADQSYWHRTAGSVNRFNVWKRGISYTIFLRRKIIEAVGYFDESLGVGAGTAWGSGEETDYLLRAINLGKQIYYMPSITVEHPGEIQSNESPNVSTNKSRYYAAGKGRVLRKSNSPLWFFTYQCLKPLAKSCLGVILRHPEQQKLGWDVFTGILEGWGSSDIV